MKKIFFGIALLLLIGAIGYYLYNKPVEGTSDRSPDFELTAVELVNQYTLDEQQADAMYLGKILQIEGELLEVETGDFTVVTLKGVDISNVRAQLVAGADSESFKNQKRITIKGKCAGTLLDVTLNDSIIIQ